MKNHRIIWGLGHIVCKIAHGKMKSNQPSFKYEKASGVCPCSAVLRCLRFERGFPFPDMQHTLGRFEFSPRLLIEISFSHYGVPAK